MSCIPGKHLPTPSCPRNIGSCVEPLMRLKMLAFGSLMAASSCSSHPARSSTAMELPQMTFFEQLMDAASSIPIEDGTDPNDEFAKSSFSLFALSLTKLSDDEREAHLAHVEENLREAIRLFENAHR